MQKLISTILAVSLIASVGVTAFAVETSGKHISDKYPTSSNFDGHVYIDDVDPDDDDDFELDPSEEYEFDLVDASGDYLDEDFFDDDYKVSVKVTSGDSYVSSCKLDTKESLLTIKTKSSTRDRDFTVEITSKERGKSSNGGSVRYDFTIIGSSNSSSADTEEIDDDEYDLDLNERYNLKFDKDLARCKVFFEDEAYVYYRLGSTTKYSVECNDTENKSVIAKAPDDAELRFYKFPTKNSLQYDATVGISIENDEKYLYEIDSSNKLTLLDTTKSNGYLTFKTNKLGAYVISDTKLSSSGSSSNSSNSNTSKPTEENSSSSNNAATDITYSTLKNALNAVPSGGTGIVYINDNSTLNVSDLKSAFNGNSSKMIKFICKNGSAVKYQYYMNSRQVAAMTGSTYKLGMDLTASSTTNLFNKYYKNNIKVVGSKATPNGSKGIFAAKVNLSGMNKNNLKVYIYNRSANRYELVSNPYLSVDANSFVHFTVPVGYDVIISDSYLQSK